MRHDASMMSSTIPLGIFKLTDAVRLATYPTVAESKQSEQPMAQALLVCDHIIVEQGTNKKSLIGIFNTIASANFPMTHTRMSVFASLTNGRGSLPAMLRFVRVSDEKEIFSHKGQVEFPDPNQVIELVFNLVNTPFEEPGLYTFELLCDGDLLLEKRFNVAKLTQKPLQ